MRNIAVLSSDVNPFYSFFVPLASMAWRRCGWQPLCLLIGNENQWKDHPNASYSLKIVRERGDLIEFVSPAPGYRVSTTAQLVRLLASASTLVEDVDYLITSDIDMLPLNPEFFRRQNMDLDFHVFSADAYADLTQGHFPPKFPMCYLGAKASFWRSMMGIESRDVGLEAVRALHGRPDTWDNDEMYLTSKLYSHPIFDGPVERVGDLRYRKGRLDLMCRTWPFSRASKRIDREAWYYDDPGDLIDCHCHRPGFEKTDVLRKVFSRYLASDICWFDTYLSEYARLTSRG